MHPLEIVRETIGGTVIYVQLWEIDRSKMGTVNCVQARGNLMFSCSATVKVLCIFFEVGTALQRENSIEKWVLNQVWRITHFLQVVVDVWIRQCSRDR